MLVLALPLWSVKICIVTPEQQFEQEASRSNWRERIKGFAAGVGICALAAVGTLVYLNREEDYISSGPSHEQAHDDGILRVGTKNIYRRAARNIDEINYLFTKRNFDAVMFQEVTAESANSLTAALGSKLYVTYQVADKRQSGIGNMIITRGKPEDIETEIIEGDSNLEFASGSAAGLVEDLKGLTAGKGVGLKATRKETEENRVLMALTIKGPNNLKTRLITGHINGSSTLRGLLQLNTFLNFASNNRKRGRPVILCADFNNEPDIIEPLFGDRGFITKRTSTSTLKKKPKDKSGEVDMCAYSSAGKLGPMRTRVLDGFFQDREIDHKFVMAEARPLNYRLNELVTLEEFQDHEDKLSD